MRSASCPAAKSMHHAYLGGLLEHTLTLMQARRRVCPLYPKINRDLVLDGPLPPRPGQDPRTVYDRAFSYTDRGELIGHIVEGAIMLHDKAQQVIRETGQRLPPGALMVLQHIILSHHGECPSSVRPRSPRRPRRSSSRSRQPRRQDHDGPRRDRPDRTGGLDLGGNFTEKQWALDTKLFRPDPSLQPVRDQLDDLFSHTSLKHLRAARPFLQYLQNEQVPTAVILDLIAFKLLSDREMRYTLLAESDTDRRTTLILKELSSLQTLIERAQAQHPEQWPRGCSWN
jgi:hypothetical protein